ncbi:CHASE3 domain-containing protein [Methylopila musalis]|uniref:histidine kinase n=1 Tax=Methylopila musalis TaxID=1134781 RepID=A0ABW3Z7Q4_9HYPH
MADTQTDRRAGRNEILLLALGFGALAVVGGSSIWVAQRNAVFNRQVADTLEFRSDVRRLLDIAQDAETGQRGYLLTRRESYLRPYDLSVPRRDAQVAALRARAATESQRDDVETLIRSLDAKLAELAHTVELSKAGRWDEALEVVRGDSGRDAMDLMRSLSNKMVEVETRRFEESFAYAGWLAQLQLVVVTIGLLLAAALALVAQLLVRRQGRAIEQAHAELAEVNAGLERAVDERTAELVSANEEIQRFAYIVSHDLRAPLVNVMGFTSELDAAGKTLKSQIDKVAERAPDLLDADARLAVNEDLPEAIGFIRTSTAKMDRLINAILRLSREGRRVITPEAVKVDEMVVAIARTLHQQTEAANARITAAPGLPTLVTDRMSFEQILQNLIENAVKYLDRSRPGAIVVRGQRLGPQVQYAIEDNGRGIDPRDHERVFELFRRAGAQDQPGEGLGLAFVRASVRRLGGTIRLESEPGKGSTFFLTFPAVYRPQQNEAS